MKSDTDEIILASKFYLYYLYMYMCAYSWVWIQVPTLIQHV